MELQPILGRQDTPKPNLWYVLSPEGEGPSLLVGHTCTFVAHDSDKGQTAKVFIIGGANPDGAFDDVYVLDLEKFSWLRPEWEGLVARYEHSAFTPRSQPNHIVVFGGAQQANNLNDIQILNTDSGTWSSPEITGSPPCPRTCHSMAGIGDKLFVFAGGLSGADPVTDTQMHIFDAANNSWLQLSSKGDVPSPRHGHMMVAIGTDIYVHGGMEGTTIHSDLYKFNTETNMWSKLEAMGDIPAARTAHAAAAAGNKIYIFGGMDSVGCGLDDFFVLDTASKKWKQVKFDGPPPTPRLDHTLCTVTIPKSSGDAVATGKPQEDHTLVLVFGGMDSQGEIFSDCLVFKVDNS